MAGVALLVLVAQPNRVGTCYDASVELLSKIVAAVHEARIASQLSAEDLAKAAEVPRAVLQSFESGQLGLTTTQLQRLAEALSIDFGALLQGHAEQRPVPSVFLKHTAYLDFDDRDSPALDQALAQGAALGGLRRLLGEADGPLGSGAFEQQGVAGDHGASAALDGYRCARVVRQWLNIGPSQFGDLREILEERFCIAVVVQPLASGRITAVSIRAGATAAVVLNSRDSNRIRNPLVDRVSLAHELCHILFDPSPGGIHLVLDGDSSQKGSLAEQRARAFAAELLLPTDGLTALLGAPVRQSVLELARSLVQRSRSHFGTPHEIAANHLCNQGFADKSIREWLEVARSMFEGPPPPMTAPQPGDPSLQLQALTQRAYREGLLMDSEARGLLGLDPLTPLPWDGVEL